MAIKTTQLLLGGEVRNLKFGRMTVLKYAGEIVDDPMELFSAELSPKKAYTRIFAFVYAGLRSAGNDVTPEQVDEWVQDMGYEDGASILKVVGEAMLGGNGKPGEAEAQAPGEALPGVN